MSLKRFDKYPRYLSERSSIILLSASGLSDREVGEKLGIHYNTVGKWRNRFLAALPLIKTAETNLPAKEVRKIIDEVLSDRYRSGAPCTYGKDIRNTVKLYACSDPKTFGVTASHWSLNFLRTALIKEGVVPDISLGEIYHILQTDNIKPWRIRYWLHSKEKYEDYESYRKKIQLINETYALAEKVRNAKDDACCCIYCFDEMTGMQSLKHKYPDKPPGPDRPRYIEFEYRRNGTASLIGFTDVITGAVFDPFIGETRTEEDLAAALREVLSANPGKKHYFICDNLNTHYSESVVRVVSESIQYTGDLGVKSKSGILKDSKSRIAFLTDDTHNIVFRFTPIHCSWMNMQEIFFGILNRQLLKHYSTDSLEELKQTIIAYYHQYNEAFAHPFKWTYNSVPADPNEKKEMQGKEETSTRETLNNSTD